MTPNPRGTSIKPIEQDLSIYLTNNALEDGIIRLTILTIDPDGIGRTVVLTGQLDRTEAIQLARAILTSLPHPDAEITPRHTVSSRTQRITTYGHDTHNQVIHRIKYTGARTLEYILDSPIWDAVQLNLTPDAATALARELIERSQA